MSRREMRGSHGLTAQEFEDVMNVQQEMMSVIRGDRPFSYPHADRNLSAPGQRYQPNRQEEEYMLQSRSRLMGSMILYTAIGFAVPYITLRLPMVANNTRFFKRPFAWAMFGGTIGMFSSLSSSRLTMTEGLMKQQDSPIARELRYRFWLVNPNHPYLRGYEDEFDEFERWDRAKHYRSRDYANDYSGSGRRSRRRDDYDDDYYDDYDDDEYRGDRRRSRRRRRSSRDDDDYGDYDDYDSQRWTQGSGGPMRREKPAMRPRSPSPTGPSSSSMDEGYASSARRRRRERDRDRDLSEPSARKRRRRPDGSGGGGGSSYSYGTKSKSGSDSGSTTIIQDDGISFTDLDMEKQKKRERFYKGRGGEFNRDSDGTLEIKSDDVDTHLSDMFSGSKKD